MTEGPAARANRLIAEGRHREALSAMAEMGDPSGRPDLLQNIGVSWYRLGEHERALTYLGQAHEAAPDDARTINNIAVISAEIGAPQVIDDAVLTPQSLNDLGLQAYYQGRFDEARRWLEIAIARAPDYVPAYHNMIDLLGDDEIETWLARIEALRPDTDEHAAAVGYMRGDLKHRAGDREGALSAWAEGAETKRRTLKGFDIRAHRGIVDGIIRASSVDALRRLQTGSTDERAFTFIVGLPRSGSTLTARLLCGDPAMHDLGERRALAIASIAQLEATALPHARAFEALTAAATARVFSDYVAELPPGGRYLDKYLENFLFLGLIWAAFPNARIIHTRRDRFDTLFSCYTKNFTHGNAWSYRPEDCTAYAAEMDRLMDHWAEVLPPAMLLTSEYETLTHNPDAALDRLGAHAGIDVATARARGHQSGGRVETASAKQIREGVKRRDRSPYEAYKQLIAF